MVIGYLGCTSTFDAGFRLRAQIPSKYMNVDCRFGYPGNVTIVFGTLFDIEVVKRVKTPIIYDIVAEHFNDNYAEKVNWICNRAEVITTTCGYLQHIIHNAIKRTAIIIPDTYEGEIKQPAIIGNNIVWYGHPINYGSLRPYLNIKNLRVCTDKRVATDSLGWTPSLESYEIEQSAIVLLTSGNFKCSQNRVVKALAAGRPIVTTTNIPSTWKEFEKFMWANDNVQASIDWILENRTEALDKVREGQAYIQKHYNPAKIGAMWENLAHSTYQADKGT